MASNKAKIGRAVWTGELTLGLLHVPVKAYTVERSDARPYLRTVARKTGAPLEQLPMIDPTTGEPTGPEESGKAAKVGKQYIDVSDVVEDLEVPRDKELRIASTARDVPPEAFGGKRYVLIPDGAAGRPYAVLRDALRREKVDGVVEVNLSGSFRSLYVIRATKDRLMAYSVSYAAWLKTGFEEYLPTQRPSKDEIDLARRLVEAVPVRPFAAHVDQHGQALQAAIEEREAKAYSDPRDKAQKGDVLEFRELLERAVETTREVGAQ